MSQWIITLFIYITFYIISGYATTDILRLAKGCDTDIGDSDCFCPVCGHKISLISQIPILSYFFCGGTCIRCGSKIPKSELFLECLVFAVLSISVTFFHFSWYACILSFLFYEAIKAIFLFAHGTRETDFVKNLLVSIRNNLILWFLVSLLFFLRSIIF